MQQSDRATNDSLSPAKEDLVLTDLWLVVRKRRILLASAAIGLALLVGAYGLFRGEMFTATGEIQIQPDSAAELKQSINSVLSGGSQLDVIIESDSRILASEKLLTTVARTLKLQDNACFMGNKAACRMGFLKGEAATTVHGNLDDPRERSAIVGNLRGHLTIARVPRTQMITISYVSLSPKLSADIVNALESEFIKNNFVAHYSNTQQVTNWLTGQIDDLRAIVQQSQDKMVDLQKKLGISALDPSHSMIVQEISNLEKGASDATEQRVRRDQGFKLVQHLSSECLRFSSESTAFGIGETKTLRT